MAMYQVLRPHSFDEMIGNKAVVTSLRAVLHSKQCPHAFLFTGPSGCGKTTLARIIAAEVGCQALNIYEINAADTRGIDTIRELNSEMFIMPIGGKARIIILDEAHQLTKEAQNALLKMLEDTPSYQYFVLCSTEPEKLVATVRNRCTIFNVEKLSTDELCELLAIAVGVFNLPIDDDTIEVIAKGSNGSPRQALVLLEQVSTLTKDEIALVLSKYSVECTVDVIELCRAFMQSKDVMRCMSILKRIEDDPEKIRRMVLGYLQACALNARDERGLAAVVKKIAAFEEADTFRNGKAALISATFLATYME